MVRRIHCNNCGVSWSLHPADVGMGLSSRKVPILAKKPEDHARKETIIEGAHTHIIEEQLSTLHCDACDEPIKDGEMAWAITTWHPDEEETGSWEHEYGTVC